jgi:chromosome segregation ATPase
MEEVIKMSIVRNKDKRTGTTYVYESESYWDKEKKQPRNKRTLIGKIDEKTGELVPTDGRGRKRKTAAEINVGNDKALISEYENRLQEKETAIKQLTTENQQLKKDLSEVMKNLRKITDKYEGNI